MENKVLMNPFNPSFGKVPEIFLGRSGILKKIVQGLENYNSPYQTTMIYGVRGVGKTSLLTDVAHTMKKKENWIVVNLIPNVNLMSNLMESIYQQATSEVKKVLDRIDGVKLSAFKEAVGIEFHKSSYKFTTQVMLESVLKKLKAQGIHLLVTIDEAASTEEIKNFAALYQVMIREEYWISLIMTGLPEQISELQNDKVLTFLLRSKKIKLDPLKAMDIKYRYKRVFTQANRKLSDDLATKMTLLTNGYAYAFQLLGYLVWESENSVITEETLKSILDEYKEELYSNVYSKIYTELSSMDRKFIDAMIKFISEKQDNRGRQIPIAYIEKELGKPHNYVVNYRHRLLEDQVIEAPQRGSVQFTLPFFKEFVEDNSIFFS